MGLSPEQAKGRIKNIAIKTGADPRVLMRIYMMERFLERVSLSMYKDNFIIKGGMLVIAMVGVSMRSTMDIDTSIKSQTLSLENAKRIVMEIAKVPIEDKVLFEITEAESIMDEMEYPGIRLHLAAKFGQMVTPIKIDISTGDVITPKAIEYSYTLMLEDRKINLLAYNLETMLGEKLQTILVRDVANTRMRDFYDIYTLMKTLASDISTDTFREAYKATCKNRGSLHLLGNESKIIATIATDKILNNLWLNYQKKYSYASNISYAATIECARELIAMLKA